jgi:polyferredoxin
MRFRDVLELKTLLEEAEKKAKEKDKPKTESKGNFLEVFALLLIFFPVVGPASVYAWAWAFAQAAEMVKAALH